VSSGVLAFITTANNNDLKKLSSRIEVDALNDVLQYHRSSSPVSTNAYHCCRSRISNLLSSKMRDGTETTTALDDGNYETSAEDFDEEEKVNPLQSAGLSFISASDKSLGMLFYNIGGMDHKEIQALLLQAGTHLVEAGESWTTDWNSVRESMESASQAFYDISNVFGSANIDESMPLGTLFENIGRELEDISSISGCTSVGPPCSVPNLLAVEEHLTAVSKILKKNSVAATDEHMMCTLFKEVAELFGEMAGRYVDNDGQNSEVTV
jgi:hypothetical protein